MDKLIKIAVVVAVLLAGGGVFHHYVIYLPGVERAKQEQLAAEKQAAAENQLRKKMAYEQCIAVAEENYTANWASACLSASVRTEEDRKNCFADPAITTNQFMGVAYCRSTFPPRDPGPNCTLPGSRATTVNEYHTAEKQKCMEEAKANL